MAKLSPLGTVSNSQTKGHFGIQPRRATTVLSLLRKTFNQKIRGGEVVVAQLVERLLSIPEVRGSTPVIGKIY